LALIEIKSASQVDERDIRTVATFQKDIKESQAFCLSRDPRAQVIDNVRLLPWQQGLVELF
jgi:hypothetical protein